MTFGHKKASLALTAMWRTKIWHTGHLNHHNNRHNLDFGYKSQKEACSFLITGSSKVKPVVEYLIERAFPPIVYIWLQQNQDSCKHNKASPLAAQNIKHRRLKFGDITFCIYMFSVCITKYHGVSHRIFIDFGRQN